jgi:hypothetical protein
MAGNILKAHWYVAANELKERWPDLTQKDLLYVRGDQEKLVEVVRKRRHVSEKEARADVEFFIRHLRTDQNVA